MPPQCSGEPTNRSASLTLLTSGTLQEFAPHRLHTYELSTGTLMFKNIPFQAIAKSMTESASTFNPNAMQKAVNPIQDNLKAWTDLAMSQAKEANAIFEESVKSLKEVKDPQAALEVFKAVSEVGTSIFAKNLKEATLLSVEQLHATVGAVQKSHPVPEVFAEFAKNFKAAASK
jgi:hypothetical protein